MMKLAKWSVLLCLLFGLTAQSAFAGGEGDCTDGIDNDGDGAYDHPEDLGCSDPDSYFEDPDTDGVADVSDNCVFESNEDQADFDADGFGDVCDEDDDDDGLPDSAETGTGVFAGPDDTGTDPKNPDSDGDGIEDGTEVASGSDPNHAGAGLPVVVPATGMATRGVIAFGITLLVALRRRGRN
jgi:hypothetical protein